MNEPAPKHKTSKRSLLWGLATIALGLFFVADVFLPDCLPFVDEIVAGILTIVSGYKTLQSYFAKDK